MQRLIYGRFDEGSLGIGEMMDLGDELGVPFTMFLDVAERVSYGDEIDDVGRYIADRGHDLQLHFHPEVLPESYWRERGLSTPQGKRWNYSKAHVDASMADAMAWFGEIAGHPPVAYRAGSFQINADWLRSAASHGVVVSSNHSYQSYTNQGREPVAPPDVGHFRWDLGLVELPVSQVLADDVWRSFSVPMNAKHDPYYTKMLQAFAEEDTTTPVVLLLHSWSLLGYGGDKRRRMNGIAPHRMRKLRRILEFAAEHFQPIGMQQYAQMDLAGLPVRPFPLDG